MFGDLGQGAALSLLGLYLYKKKGLALGAIMSIIGVSSMVFGLLYGSVFGFEDWIPALWQHPARDINSTLFFAVGIGIFLILTSMVINIVNALNQKNWGKLIFSPNGIAGIVFYGAIIGIVLAYITGYTALALTLLIVFVIVPLVLIAFREPLTSLIEGKKAHINGIGIFLLETIIELFEVLLTYFTNTVSFVRVGAFALSHAGMMSVVMLLSHSTTDERAINIPVIILGNIVVMVLEGLVVGIQVLRLEFYEMFSRFFDGDGRAFNSFKKGK
jgi:V/A-type H+-transporting ATPase subunit I